MLVKITDCKDRCACFADAATGLIEHEWKKVVTRACAKRFSEGAILYIV